MAFRRGGRADAAAETGELERKIDERVYRLYGLTAEESKSLKGRQNSDEPARETSAESANAATRCACWTVRPRRNEGWS